MLFFSHLAMDRDRLPGVQHLRLSHIKLSCFTFWALPRNCPCHYEGNDERMKDVDENEVEELMYPEEVGGGEPYGLQPQRGGRDQAGDRYGEDGPPVEQD